MEMSNFTVVRAVLRNDYWSRNLIGPYRFCVISPRNSSSFTRLFLAGRCARAGHETRGYHTDTTVKFVVTLSQEKMKEVERIGFHKKLKLESSINT